MQAPAPIPVFRPSYLTDGVEFQGSLTESPANVFYQRVNASIASLSRMQFQWRSVSDQLLVSPVMMLRFRIKVQCPQLWNQLTSFCSVHGVQTTYGGNIPSILHAANTAGTKQIGVPSIQFADGDALANVASSINLTFNGTSLSLNRTNRWWRDYTRTQLASDDAARIYKSGGATTRTMLAELPCQLCGGATGARGTTRNPSWNCPRLGNRRADQESIRDGCRSNHILQIEDGHL